MKKFVLAGIIVAAVTALGLAPAKADNLAYATFQSTNNFGILNLNTGAFSLLGNSGQGLDTGFGEFNGLLYASDYHTSPGTLYRVNTTNGQLTSLGTSGIAGLTYDGIGSTSAGLFGLGTNANLYSINPTTGAATLIGATGLSETGFRTLSDSTGSVLYYEQGSVFYSINTATGAATSLGPSTTYGGMVFENGVLYGGQNSPSQIDTINPANGAFTIGPGVSGGGILFGLAPLVPEPSSWVLLGVGVSVLLAVRRRARRA